METHPYSQLRQVSHLHACRCLRRSLTQLRRVVAATDNGWKSRWDEWMENQRIYKVSTQMKELLAKEASAGVGRGTVGPKQLTKKQAAEQAEKERIQRQEAKAAQRQKEQERLLLKDVARLGRERQERKRKLAEKQVRALRLSKM